MKDWWQQEWAKTRTQLAANPRLRLGLMAIPLIALLYLNLLLGDSRRELHATIADLHEELLDARQLASQDAWVERLEQARAQLETQRKGLFGSADSEAFARADIQANAKALLERQRLEQIRIEVSTAGKADPDTRLIPLQVRLAGNAQGEQLYNLIAAMEAGSPGYRIDSLNVQAQQGKHLVFSLIASVWYSPWSAP
ncbi:GspMb/PilO family protein [Azotobacter armeniacus]